MLHMYQISDTIVAKGGIHMIRSKLKIQMIKEEIDVNTLAELTGYHRTHITGIGNGKREGSTIFWNKAAKALHCKVEDIK